MIRPLMIFLFFSATLCLAQSPPAPPAAPPGLLPNEMPSSEDSGLVIKENRFTYDGNEGRDPFKIYKEPIILNGPPQDPTLGQGDKPIITEKNIKTALVPSEVTVLGILYKKVDPIALVAVKGVKGINQLKLNSLIGRNEGRVIDIKKDQIVIEQVKDFDGQKYTEKVVLKVRQKKE